MGKLVKLTIDGVEFEAEEGIAVIEAAKQIGVAIPHYCYHPKLSIAANCRMCLVEFAGMPTTYLTKEVKLQPACQMTVREGMVVNTQSPRVLDVQQSVMEFLLLNHPVDCAVCDQSGECKLQDYYMLHGQYDARIEKSQKVHAQKAKQIGPHVHLDQERCVKCTRCVRFMDEVAGNSQIGLFQRGDHSVIDTYPGQPLDDPYSMNVIDICPVGALTSSDFRFNMRVWWLKKTPSVCVGCSRGCNMFIDHNNGIVNRLRPRDNDAVNESWMCDDGRMTYASFNEGRLLSHRVGGELSETSAAIAAAAEAVKGGGVAVLLSAQASVEEAYLAALVARDGIHAAHVAVTGNPHGVEDKLLRRADKNPNRAGVAMALSAVGVVPSSIDDVLKAIDAGQVTKVLLVGTELPDDRLAAALARVETVVMSRTDDALVKRAKVALAWSSHAESSGTFVNEFKRAQRFRRAFASRGMSREGYLLLRDLGRALGMALGFTDPAQVFNQLATLEGAFKGMKAGMIGEQGFDLTGPIPSAQVTGATHAKEAVASAAV